MKLSERIELGVELYGARLRPDAYATLMGSNVCSVCLLTAAALSVDQDEKEIVDYVMVEGIYDDPDFDETQTYFYEDYDNLDEYIHDKLETVIVPVRNPVTGTHETAYAAIISLYDEYHWSPERIIAWLKEQGL